MFARPLPGLEVRLAAAWLSSEYKDFESAAFGGDHSGNELIGAPNYSGSGSIAYEINVGDGVARAQVSTSYTDNVHFYADHLARHGQSAVWLLNGVCASRGRRLPRTWCAGSLASLAIGRAGSFSEVVPYGDSIHAWPR